MPLKKSTKTEKPTAAAETSQAPEEPTPNGGRGQHEGKRGGPALWTMPRLKVLKKVMEEIAASPGDLTAGAVTRALQAHPAFKGDEARLTKASVSQQIHKARKAGAILPELSRTKGPRLDYLALNEMDDTEE